MNRIVTTDRYLAGMVNGGPAAFKPADIERIGQLLFATAAEGLVVVNGEGTILICNPRLDGMFGYGTGELLGGKIEMLLPDAARERHVKHRHAYDHKPVQRSMGIGMDLSGKRKDGSVFPVEVSLNHFEVDGHRFVMGLVTDITLRRQAEDELQRTNQELEQRVDQRTAELREAEQNVRRSLEKEKELHALKGRFVAMASHEFRTPLSTILNSAGLVKRYMEAGSQEKAEEHLTRIRAKVREMTAMLNEFLSLEKIEQGQVVCRPEPFDIVDLGIELIEELRPLARPGQAIDFDHQGDERSVTLDRQMLSNVIANLLTNAMKYSGEEHHITFRSTIRDGRLTLTVQDPGIGIPKDEQQHLFERFFRGRNATTIQGTGLGLNIVKRYLGLLDGTISFASEPGNTVFTVDLPQHLPSAT